ncbi:hypothetical protein [Ascidiimonas meishanensis]|uniref:hypothetical protein n=1 Tax=Ascidiimonas meishanensis TaxID=3128903 RepID=UPI0039B77F2B
MKKRKLQNSLRLNKERISTLNSTGIKGGYLTYFCQTNNCETDNCNTNACGTTNCGTGNCPTAGHPLSDPLHCRTCMVTCYQ